MAAAHADPGADDIDTAIDAALDVLHRLSAKDWDLPAGDVTWTCRAVLAHMIECLVAYAAQLATGAADTYLPLVVTVEDDADAPAALEALRAASLLLSAVVRTSLPGATGWHPFGNADAAATAAMGVVELLVHTYDVCSGLGTSWQGPQRPSGSALRRIFPDVPANLVEEDPWKALLWATGRLDLPGNPRRTQWRWHNERP